MVLFRCFLTSLILLVLSPVGALTLAEALALSASHPALVESGLNVDQTGAMARDAGKRGSDGVSLEVENFSGRLPGFSQAEVTVAFKRPILDGRKAQAQKSLAALSIASARLEQTALKREIGNRVQTAFHRVIGLQNLYRNAQELSRINHDMFEATKARVEAGASPEQEIVKAQLDIDRVEVERKNLEGQRTEAMLVLYREIGTGQIPQGAAVCTFTPDIELPETELLMQKAVEIHPTLLSIDQNLKGSRARLDLLKAENRPSFQWVAGARTFREADTHAYVLALEAELPNRSANQGVRNASHIEMTKLEATREKTQRELHAALLEQVQRFQRSRETVLSLRNQILPNAQKALELALEGYRLGKTDQVVVLEARKVYAEVARQSLTALSELYEALDAVEQLSGVCLVGETH